MRYEIRYKIKPYGFGGRESDKKGPFPIFVIHYRPCGAKKWQRLWNAEIDLYTFRRFRRTSYYDSFDKSMEFVSLSRMSDYERLELFMRILKDEYGNSIERLVKSIVTEEIVMQDADEAERIKAESMAMAFVTDGWKSLTVDIPSST